MNADYINSYVDVKGEEITRKNFDKMLVVIFAGFKFLFDRIFSILALIILSPILLIIAVAIKLDSKGPVLFIQERTGKGGKSIDIYKFRSMHADNDMRDLSKGDQITKVGKFIRRTSLDELPQLISIAKGDMSFIGPRPWVPEYYENMNEVQRHRYAVRPGLTGLAQANGRNAITIFDKIKYDLEYIEKYSLRQDIKIVFLTIKAVFVGTGVDAGKQTIHNELNDLKEYNCKKNLITK